LVNKPPSTSRSYTIFFPNSGLTKTISVVKILRLIWLVTEQTEGFKPHHCRWQLLPSPPWPENVGILLKRQTRSMRTAGATNMLMFARRIQGWLLLPVPRFFILSSFYLFSLSNLVLLLNSSLFSFPLYFNIYSPWYHYYQAIFRIIITLLSLFSIFVLISLLGLFLLRFLSLSNTWNMSRGIRSSTGHVAIAISLEGLLVWWFRSSSYAQIPPINKSQYVNCTEYHTLH